MAIPRDYETLMLKRDAKEKFRATKKYLEERMGMELSHSQAMIMMCNDLLPSSKSGGSHDKEEVVGKASTK